MLSASHGVGAVQLKGGETGENKSVADGLIQVPIFGSQCSFNPQKHIDGNQKIPRAQAAFFGWLYQTLGKSMGINQRPSPQGDDGALLASVCDEGVRVYDADHRYKVVQELEKVWGTMGDDGVMVEKFRQRI